MRSTLQRITLSLALIVFTLFVAAAHAKKMYRWVDDRGNTYFSDQVPPEHIQHRREALSEKGRVIGVTEKAKTKEQLELEKRLAELRQAQELIIAKQKSDDKILLSTFRNIDDLLNAIKGKTEAVEAQIKTAVASLSQQKEQLENRQKKAASIERNAQKIPPKLLDEIKSTQDEIEQTQLSLDRLKQKQALIKKENDKDVERYLFLTRAKTDLQTQTPRTANIKEANELGLFYCENDHQCNKAWEIARAFVNFHSTTGPDIDQDNLIMSRAPSKDTDLSLSISKVAINSSEYQIFLDIRCKDSFLGRELCASQKVKDIRSAFRPYINDTLSRTADQ